MENFSKDVCVCSPWSSPGQVGVKECLKGPPDDCRVRGPVALLKDNSLDKTPEISLTTFILPLSFRCFG